MVKESRARNSVVPDRINKDLINMKHKNREIASNTISQFQKIPNLESKQVKKIIQNLMPAVVIDDIIKDDEKEKKEIEHQ